MQVSAGDEEVRGRLSEFEKQLCNALQRGLPMCPRPFAEVAKALGTDEQKVLRCVRKLKRLGVIRRVGAVINHRAIGAVSTLAAAHVPAEKLVSVVEAVNSLAGVSHNYLRRHHYNLWFTLQAESMGQIERELGRLSRRFGIGVRSLPVERVFKLDVRFDAQSKGRSLLCPCEKVRKTRSVALSRKEKAVLSRLRSDLDLVERPFEQLCGEGVTEKELLATAKKLAAKGVIRRIGAVVDHRKLGFVANALFCCKASRGKIAGAGKKLAALSIVSHCYQRKAAKDWPYNLYAMMHGRNMAGIEGVVKDFVDSEGIELFELLPTEREFKKGLGKGQF